MAAPEGSGSASSSSGFVPGSTPNFEYPGATAKAKAQRKKRLYPTPVVALPHKEARASMSDSPWVINSRAQLEADDAARLTREGRQHLPDHLQLSLLENRNRVLDALLNHPDHRLELYRAPSRHTSYVLGRPVQVLQATYSLEPADCWDCYLPSLFGIKCLSVVGRTAKRPETAIEAKHALFSSWKDVILPYCTHPEFSDDTLFFVAEADWRLYKEHCTLDLRSKVLESGISDCWEAPVDSDVWEGTDPHGSFQFRSGFSPPTQELEDLVMICNQAHRLNRGHVVWWAYNSRWFNRDGSIQKLTNHGWSLNNGSQLIALSKKGARFILDHIQPVVSGHWDCVLRSFLHKHREALPYCVHWPPIGGTVAHVSGCSTNIASDFLTCLIEVHPHQGGTRKLVGEKARCRVFAQFRKNSKRQTHYLEPLGGGTDWDSNPVDAVTRTPWMSRYEAPLLAHDYQVTDEFFLLAGTFVPREESYTSTNMETLKPCADFRKSDPDHFTCFPFKVPHHICCRSGHSADSVSQDEQRLVRRLRNQARLREWTTDIWSVVDVAGMMLPWKNTAESFESFRYLTGHQIPVDSILDQNVKHIRECIFFADP